MMQTSKIFRWLCMYSLLTSAAAFSVAQRQWTNAPTTTRCALIHCFAGEHASDISSRNAATRRRLLQSVMASLPLFLMSSPAHAKKETSLADVQAALAAVRRELEDATGGVAYLQRAIDEERYADLLDFTKTYDQVLRKNSMGTAKKGLVDRGRGTELANAVTFDLIGINRSARTGQESKDEAQKYLNELKQDVEAFLSLELAANDDA